MLFQVVSDLHIEYKSDEIPDPLSMITPSADILILAGDVGSLYKFRQFSGFMVKLCKLYKKVIYITGNHEYYNSNQHQQLTIEELNERVYRLQAEIENFYFLNRKSIKIGDVCIVGCTLWSNASLNDSINPVITGRIGSLDRESYNTLHSKDLYYILGMIRYCKLNKLKIVIITHHCPIHLKNVKKGHSECLYYNGLQPILDCGAIHTWVAGHIHSNYFYTSRRGTNLVSNQRGKFYDPSFKDFNPSYIINVN